MNLVADDVQGVVIPGAGHWVAEEAPDEMLAALTPFLAASSPDGANATASRDSGRRLRFERRRRPRRACGPPPSARSVPPTLSRPKAPAQKEMHDADNRR